MVEVIPMDACRFLKMRYLRIPLHRVQWKRIWFGHFQCFIIKISQEKPRACA